LAAGRVIAAMERPAESGAWEKVGHVFSAAD
jgi:hypothetical protein